MLTESVAIMLHLADRFPDAGLGAPVGTRARSELYQWLSYLASAVQATHMHWFYPERFATDRDAAGPIRACATAALCRHIDWIDGAARHPDVARRRRPQRCRPVPLHADAVGPSSRAAGRGGAARSRPLRADAPAAGGAANDVGGGALGLFGLLPAQAVERLLRPASRPWRGPSRRAPDRAAPCVDALRELGHGPAGGGELLGGGLERALRGVPVGLGARRGPPGPPAQRPRRAPGASRRPRRCCPAGDPFLRLRGLRGGRGRGALRRGGRAGARRGSAMPAGKPTARCSRTRTPRRTCSARSASSAAACRVSRTRSSVAAGRGPARRRRPSRPGASRPAGPLPAPSAAARRSAAEPAPSCTSRRPRAAHPGGRPRDRACRGRPGSRSTAATLGFAQLRGRSGLGAACPRREAPWRRRTARARTRPGRRRRASSSTSVRSGSHTANATPAASAGCLNPLTGLDVGGARGRCPTR